MKIWIDLANSPHPLLFAPITAQLEQLGHRVELTVRDSAQTLALARQRWPALDVVGGPSPPGKARKARAIASRVARLRAWARSRRPDLALGHNSYAQIAAARSLRIPVVTAMDYEYQPANHLAFRLADVVLLPAVLPLELVRAQGATPRKVSRYGGIKEEIYVADFDVDPDILAKIGVEPDPSCTVVVLRAPPEGATYHDFENPLYTALLDRLAGDPAVRCVVLARHAEQRRELERLRASNFVVPERAVDSRSLMYAADVMVGAGGTMTREAALLGTTTFSVFSGRTPFVDRWLESRGLLRRLATVDDLLLRPRSTPRPPLAQLRERGRALAAEFATTAAAAVDTHP